MCEKERKRKREQAVVCDSVNTQLGNYQQTHTHTQPYIYAHRRTSTQTPIDILTLTHTLMHILCTCTCMYGCIWSSYLLLSCGRKRLYQLLLMQTPISYPIDPGGTFLLTCQRVCLAYSVYRTQTGSVLLMV